MQRLLLLALLFAGTLAAQSGPANQFLVRLERVDPNVSLGSLGEEGRRLGAEHLAYWNVLLKEGKLALGGQAYGEKGMFGILLINAETREAATEIINADPIVKAKVFRGVEYTPFRTFFKPAPDCSSNSAH